MISSSWQVPGASMLAAVRTCAKGVPLSQRRACKPLSAAQTSQSLPYYHLEGWAQPWGARTGGL